MCINFFGSRFPSLHPSSTANAGRRQRQQQLQRLPISNFPPLAPSLVQQGTSGGEPFVERKSRFKAQLSLGEFIPTANLLDSDIAARSLLRGPTSPQLNVDARGATNGIESESEDGRKGESFPFLLSLPDSLSTRFGPSSVCIGECARTN